MERDVQGVLRGGCRRCGDCSAYRAPAPPAVLCAACHHPPGLHQNMDQPQAQPQQIISSAQQPSGIPDYAGTGYAPYGSEYFAPHQDQRPSLPTCKRSDCSNPVHYDPTFGPFEYCSPRCRDAQLLEHEKDKLLKDIARQTEELHQLRRDDGYKRL
ncbi:hypothetical protein EMCRGX_G002372 [Ephydatia muelleri]|eukprot:Em0001g2150a